MKIGGILSAIVVIVALIICYWKFDDKIVTTSVIAATSLVNLYNFIKQRNINKKNRHSVENENDIKKFIKEMK